MNIFVTSVCPARCARHLDDKRVVKMCLETAQILCTAINEHGGSSPYRSTHKNHPASIWARQTRKNWQWLFTHGLALCNEYKERYGREHKCESVIKALWEKRDYIPNGEMTTFPNCAANKSLNLDFKHIEPVTEAYKQYLNARWETDKREPTWYGER